MGVMVVRISLPEEIAIALIDDGTAVRPYRTRGASPHDVITLLIDGVNTAASIVTLAATAAACRRLASRIATRMHHGKDSPMTVTITGPNWPKPRHLEVSSSGSAAEDEILDFLIAALSADSEKSLQTRKSED
jgi:hypothetical protein